MAGWVGYPDFYATSFTANGDLLSQWRGYGSSGGGYAIGFDAERLASPPSPYPQPGRFLNRVIYEEETQLGVLRATADKMLKLFAALGKVVGFVFSFKDPAWAEEQGVRYTFYPQTNSTASNSDPAVVSPFPMSPSPWGPTLMEDCRYER